MRVSNFEKIIPKEMSIPLDVARNSSSINFLTFRVKQRMISLIISYKIKLLGYLPSEMTLRLKRVENV